MPLGYTVPGGLQFGLDEVQVRPCDAAICHGNLMHWVELDKHLLYSVVLANSLFAEHPLAVNAVEGFTTKMYATCAHRAARLGVRARLPARLVHASRLRTVSKLSQLCSCTSRSLTSHAAVPFDHLENQPI